MAPDTADGPSFAGTPPMRAERVSAVTARRLLNDEVVEPVKVAIHQIEKVRSAIEGRTYGERAIPASQDPLLERVREAKAAVEVSLEGFRRRADLVIEQNKTLKVLWMALSTALFAVGLFGLVWGVVYQSTLLLGSSAVFAGTAIVWPFNNLRRIWREEIEIRTMPDRVQAGIDSCMATAVVKDIADCFGKQLRLLDQTFERLQERSGGGTARSEAHSDGGAS